MQKITVITADVIGSRAAEINLVSLTQKLNKLNHRNLIVPFSVSRGDELQGVVTGWLHHPEIVRLLRWKCLPLKLRIGIGLGIYHGELKPDSWKLSGQAFFRARQALETIENSKDTATMIATGIIALDDIVNSIWILLDALQSRWTPGQWEAVMTYEEAGTYAAAAKKLGVAAQNVQKRCKAAHWNQFNQAEQGLKNLEKLATTIHPDLGDMPIITPKGVK